MNNYLLKFLEIIVFALFFIAIYWVIGFFCKSTFGVEIRSEKGYYVCFFLGFATRYLLIQFFSGDLS